MKTRSKKKTPRRGPNPLRSDPSRTVTLRRQLSADLKRLFARLKAAVRTLVVKEDAFGLRSASHSPFTTNTRWLLRTVSEKVEAFRSWLEAQVSSLLDAASELWNRTTQLAFSKGLNRSYDEARAAARGSAILDFYAGAKDEFSRSTLSRPDAADRIKLLASRASADLKATIAVTTAATTRSLSDALTRGGSPEDIISVLADAIDGGRDRAVTAASDEVVRAHAEGQLEGMEALGVEEVGANVEWTTRNDKKVCPACSAMEGMVFTVAESRGMIPAHPRCRCSWKAATPRPKVAVKTPTPTGNVARGVTAEMVALDRWLVR